MKKLKKGLTDVTNVTPAGPAGGRKCTQKKLSGKSPARTPKNSAIVSVKSSRATPKNLKTSPRTTFATLLRSDSLQLTADQRKVVRAVLSGQSVFFTGSAGTGKSFLLRHILGKLPSETTYITAATGVAACQIGGITLHSFAGVGNGSSPLDYCIDLALRPAVAAQWRKCTHLIIDEISMVDGEFFGKLEKVAKCVRKSELPFGGIQLILCGDFCQLPPVTKSGESKKFCFQVNTAQDVVHNLLCQSQCWGRCVRKSLILEEVKRQDDETFINILQEIRLGRCTDENAVVLQKTRHNRVDKDGVLATRLCTHKNDAEIINQAHLTRLEGEEQIFTARDSEALPSGIGESVCLKELKLKIGSQVMLTKNLDLSKNLSNGSRGVVKSFQKGYPVVHFMSGDKQRIVPVRFHIKLAGSRGTVIRSQIPLQLAWAISIHKSQIRGLRLLMSTNFTKGVTYLHKLCQEFKDGTKGLRVMDFDKTCVRANKDVLDFYENLKSGITPQSDNSNSMGLAQRCCEDTQRPVKRLRLVQHFR